MHDPSTALPNLLLAALLLPLLSFAVISIGYSVPQYLGIRTQYATQKYAAYIAIGAIVTGFGLSAYALIAVWLPTHPLAGAAHHAAHNNGPPPYVTGDWYLLGQFGNLTLTIASTNTAFGTVLLGGSDRRRTTLPHPIQPRVLQLAQ